MLKSKVGGWLFLQLLESRYNALFLKMPLTGMEMYALLILEERRWINLTG
jgi:hypothetical protein